MKKKILTFILLSAGLITSLLAGYFHSRQAKNADDGTPPAIAEKTDDSPRVAPPSPPQLIALASVQKADAPAPPETAADSSNPQVKSANDYKDVADADYKDTLDSKKEILSPVGEQVGTRPDALNTRPNDPAVELLNVPKNTLLSTPNTFNSSGPVVSPETR